MTRTGLTGSEFIVLAVIAHRVNPVRLGSLPAAGASARAPQTTHAVQWRRGGVAAWHTPPLREPQKRRAASLRRTGERSYGCSRSERTSRVATGVSGTHRWRCRTGLSQVRTYRTGRAWGGHGVGRHTDMNSGTLGGQATDGCPGATGEDRIRPRLTPEAANPTASTSVRRRARVLPRPPSSGRLGARHRRSE